MIVKKKRTGGENLELFTILAEQQTSRLGLIALNLIALL
jgi:hypothetical protein